jgi:hypothetical protein
MQVDKSLRRSTWFISQDSSGKIDDQNSLRRINEFSRAIGSCGGAREINEYSQRVQSLGQIEPLIRATRTIGYTRI